MFDDSRKTKKDDSLNDQNLENDFSHEGQKMTDSPFKLDKNSQEVEQKIKANANFKEPIENQEKKYPPKDPLAKQEEPEDMFASVEKEDKPSKEIINNLNSFKSDLKNQEITDTKEVASKTESREQENKSQVLESNTNELKKIFIKYLILTLIAAMIVAIVAFWGSNILISPTN